MHNFNEWEQTLKDKERFVYAILSVRFMFGAHA